VVLDPTRFWLRHGNADPWPCSDRTLELHHRSAAGVKYRFCVRLCVFFLLAASALLLPTAAAAQQYDLIIRNGRVLDGSGNPWYRADVAVAGERIVAVGDLAGHGARRVVDASGLYVAPGFIDVHSHAGTGLVRRELSAARTLLAQGITTVVINPDGGGAVDLVRQRRELLEHGLGVNVVQLVPHGSVRLEVLGMEDRAPTAVELERMRALLRAGMEAGAFGLSSGPYYAPGSYAATEELVELAKVVAEYGGIYTSHIRDEADFSVGVVAAVDEVIRVAREARLPGIVTHVKVLGPRVWGFSNALVHRIERAREEGVEVFADQYPYAASGTSLVGALVPRWAQVGGDTALVRRIDDPAERPRLSRDVAENLERRGGAERIQFRRHRADPSVEGRTLQAVAEERGRDAVETTLDLLRAGGASVVSFNMHDDDVERLMRQPWTMTSSDGELVPMGEGVPHPRSYGTFPRKLRTYVREKGTIDLGFAIRSMTSLPAAVHRMHGRGLVREGAIADLVVFDLERIRDPADYQQPHQLAEGMVHVLVGGRFAVEDGRFHDALHGQVLSRRPQRERAGRPVAAQR
jgi:N-acyl-D-amino-acid deacylase